MDHRPDLTLQVFSDRIAMTYWADGQRICTAYSRIIRRQGRSYELDVAQAVSYAAHMVYKIVEQQELGGRA